MKLIPGVRIRVRVMCFVITKEHKGVLCVRQCCTRRVCIWAVSGREAVQHANSDAGWRLGRRNLGLNLDSKAQTQRYAQLSDRDSA